MLVTGGAIGLLPASSEDRPSIRGGFCRLADGRLLSCRVSKCFPGSLCLSRDGTLVSGGERWLDGGTRRRIFDGEGFCSTGGGRLFVGVWRLRAGCDSGCLLGRGRLLGCRRGGCPLGGGACLVLSDDPLFACGRGRCLLSGNWRPLDCGGCGWLSASDGRLMICDCRL